MHLSIQFNPLPPKPVHVQASLPAICSRTRQSSPQPRASSYPPTSPSHTAREHPPPPHAQHHITSPRHPFSLSTAVRAPFASAHITPRLTSLPSLRCKQNTADDRPPDFPPLSRRAHQRPPSSSTTTQRPHTSLCHRTGHRPSQASEWEVCWTTRAPPALPRSVLTTTVEVIREKVQDGLTGETKEMQYTQCKIVGNGSFGVVFQTKLSPSGEDAAIKRVLQDKRFKVSTNGW